MDYSPCSHKRVPHDLATKQQGPIITMVYDALPKSLSMRNYSTQNSPQMRMPRLFHDPQREVPLGHVVHVLYMAVHAGLPRPFFRVLERTPPKERSGIEGRREWHNQACYVPCLETRNSNEFWAFPAILQKSSLALRKEFARKSGSGDGDRFSSCTQHVSVPGYRVWRLPSRYCISRSAED